MESYFGEKGSKWKCGLPKEGGSQEKILEKLRMKYAAAILTYEINTKSDDVLKAAYEYQKVDQKICDIVKNVCFYDDGKHGDGKQICSKDLLGSMEIIFVSNGGRLLGVSYNMYENLTRNMKNKNLGKWRT
ncbi:unnamed protein product [Lactuca saligna]|uniref:Uncharacterized protein n=1 Tax=Lactuca saligna TaxID=75948 RepID=A0AA35ZUN3_LACSI|nr:unnamed protein product [Lactuca saligna]